MKREILFRGKRTDRDEWIYGFLFIRDNKTYYINGSNFMLSVIPETVGQFTGLTDKNGVKIFEGDIVRVEWYDGYNHETKFSNHECYFDTELLEFGLKETFELFQCQFDYNFEVIGTIHDNPELLN